MTENKYCFRMHIRFGTRRTAVGKRNADFFASLFLFVWMFRCGKTYDFPGSVDQSVRWRSSGRSILFLRIYRAVSPRAILMCTTGIGLPSFAPLKSGVMTRTSCSTRFQSKSRFISLLARLQRMPPACFTSSMSGSVSRSL